MLALVGPTASGKTELSTPLARGLGCEIVSVDSMLVYRGMDIGTAKPSAAQRASVPHHLIDLAEPSERFTVVRFQTLGREAIERIATRGRRPLLVGGSGLYFRALVDDLAFPGTEPSVRGELEAEANAIGAERLYRRLAELDPIAAAKIEPGNMRRIVRALEVAAITGRPFSAFAAAWDRYPPDRVRAAGLDLTREVLAARVAVRVEAMFATGFVDEVRRLVERGFGGWLTSTQAIGYAEVAGYLRGRTSLEEATQATRRRTMNLARRQLAWFRKDPRIRWFRADAAGAAGPIDEIAEYLGNA